MSIYYPRIEDLRAVQGSNGWYVCDSFGVIDGPYRSSREAQATFHAEAALGHEAEGVK